MVPSPVVSRECSWSSVLVSRNLSYWYGNKSKLYEKLLMVMPSTKKDLDSIGIKITKFDKGDYEIVIGKCNTKCGKYRIQSVVGVRLESAT